MEDQIKKRNHIAKMRSMLFRVDLKSKRIKKIKSKTYHRLKINDLKKSGVGALMYPEMSKEEAKKQEMRRAEVSLKFLLHCISFSSRHCQKCNKLSCLFIHICYVLMQERMTLKHKNTGPWAKRMLRHGLNKKYDGTQAAISEQLQVNDTLSRKMNSTKDESSSDESEAELNDGSDQDTCKLIAEAKEKTLKAVEDDEVPISGLMSLPFMVILTLFSKNAFELFLFWFFTFIHVFGLVRLVLRKRKTRKLKKKLNVHLRSMKSWRTLVEQKPLKSLLMLVVEEYLGQKLQKSLKRNQTTFLITVIVVVTMIWKIMT